MDSEQRTRTDRLGKLRHLIQENDLNGVILVPGPNLQYYTGVKSILLERPFLFFVPKDGETHLVAPSFETGPYMRAPFKINVHKWDDGEGPSQAFREASNQLSLNGRWGVEGRAPFRFIHQLLEHANLVLEDAEPILQGIRETKGTDEIQLLQKAATIMAKSFLMIPNMMKTNMTEIELARDITQAIYSNGAESVDDVLVQSGPTAADPHHLPSSRKLRRKESIVVDVSCTFSGYFADITRTFAIGSDKRFQELYENVLTAQERAIAESRPGSTVGSVDNAARDYLRQKGLGEYFTHRTGHGLGLEVHEAPYIVPDGDELLRTSMVFTVEPGAYLPGKMGVRIEDDVLVTEKGRKVLTGSLPKEFGWWR